MNTLPNATKGRRLAITAEQQNSWNRAAEDYAQRGKRVGTPAAGGQSGNQVLTIRVKNNTGEDLEEFETFTADHSMSGQSGQLTIDGNEYAVSDSPIVCIGQTDKEDGAPHLLILQEPISAGEFGRAVTRGICIAKVNITNSSHHYADLPVSGSVLRSGYGGRVRILQVESAATGEQYCLVDLLQSPISDPIVTITAGPTDGLYTGFYVQRSETSPYSYVSTANEVRVIPISGGTLQIGRNYLGRTVGQVTVSTVVYDLVDVVGDANYTTLNGSGYETAWAGGLLNTTTQSIRGVKTFRNHSIYKNDTEAAGKETNISIGGAAFTTLSQGSVTIGSAGGGGLTLVSTQGVYTPSGLIEIYDDPSNLNYNLILSSGGSTPTGYTGVLVTDNWGVVQSGTVYWGQTQTVSIAYKNQSGNNETTNLVFRGGLFISSNVTNP